MANSNGKRDQLIRELKQSEERYRSLTESSVDAIITADADDLILTWNRGAELIFGYGPEMIGQHVATTIIPERYRRAHTEGIKRFLETREKHILGRKVELQALRKDGSEFPIELSLSSWKSESGLFFSAIIRDISERKRIERIREDVNRMMRHDIKSPLVGIAGLARVIQKGANLTPKQLKAAALIQDLAVKMLSFIGRTRDLYQMEEGTYRLKAEPVNILDIIQRIQKELAPMMEDKGTRVKISISGDSPEGDAERIVPGENVLLEIMFANLIKNAIEASPEGAPVEISIGNIGRDGRRFHLLDIHNKGAVPREIREKFFEPYTTFGKKGGTGLGTHSALLIARTHRGDISFSTSREDGTNVVVHLPIW